MQAHFKIISIVLILFLSLPAPASARMKAKRINKLAKDVEKKAIDDRDYFQEAYPQHDANKDYEKSSGSLWVDSFNSRLYNNLHRATRVGDMITIMVEESATGRKIAETRAQKTSENTFGVTGLFGIIQRLTGAITGLTPANMIGSSNEGNHQGLGETRREGTLNATITARIVRVLKNGDMQIRGQKNIMVNGEEQILIVEGFIRPYDISSKNTISSNYIADARITYKGFGILAEKQKPGWLTRILDKVLPF